MGAIAKGAKFRRKDSRGIALVEPSAWRLSWYYHKKCKEHRRVSRLSNCDVSKSANRIGACRDETNIM